MPVEFDVDHEARLVTFRVTGTVDATEILSALHSAFAMRKPGVVYDVFSDHLGIAKPVTPDQIKSLVAELARIGGVEGMRAVMVVGSDASYGMMRMLSTLVENLGIRVGIFREAADARKFLER